jgi:hypothetical protein
MANENLYIVKRTFFNPRDPAEQSFNVIVPATCTDLQVAKKEAKMALDREGYEPDFFSLYDVKNDCDEWKHGDGVFVYAKGPDAEVLTVAIDTVPNTRELHAGSSGRVEGPLYYVLQTIVEYNDDRSGSSRSVIAEGVHTRQDLAREQASRTLIDDNMKKEDYVEYDEYFGNAEGPFGADVLVHAVREDGRNVLVSVFLGN